MGTTLVWVALTAGAALVVAGVVAGLLHVRHNLVVVTVQGSSMLPAYAPGDRILVRRVGAERLRAGQVVALAPIFTGGAREPVRRDADPLWLLKRVSAVAGQRVPEGFAPALAPGTPVPPGSLVVAGDNREQSADSRQEGFIAADRVRGVVLRHLTRRG